MRPKKVNRTGYLFYQKYQMLLRFVISVADTPDKKMDVHAPYDCECRICGAAANGKKVVYHKKGCLKVRAQRLERRLRLRPVKSGVLTLQTVAKMSKPEFSNLLDTVIRNS